MGYKRSIGAVIILTLVWSCRKGDRDAPLVTILSPLFPASYSFGHAIEVELEARDESKIEYVSVLITDLAGRIVVGPRIVSTGGTKTFRGTLMIHFDQVKVESGNYVLRARAYDGVNHGEDLKPVTLIGAPRTLKRLFVIRQPDSFTTWIDSLVTGDTWNPAEQVSGQYNRATANSWDQSVHLFGRTQDGIRTYSGEWLQGPQQVLIPYGLSNDLFTDVHYDMITRETWVACRDGMIRQVGPSGAIVSAFGAYHPRQVVAVGRFVYIYGHNGIDAPRLSVHVKSTGALIQSLTLSYELTDLVSLGSEDQVLLVRQTGNGSTLLPYQRAGNFTDAWTSFSSAPDASVVVVTEYQTGIVLAYSGALRRFSFTGQLLAETTISSGTRALAVQEDQDIVWVLGGDALHRFSLGTLSPAGTIPVAAGAQDVALLFNK